MQLFALSVTCGGITCPAAIPQESRVDSSHPPDSVSGPENSFTFEISKSIDPKLVFDGTYAISHAIIFRVPVTALALTLSIKNIYNDKDK